MTGPNKRALEAFSKKFQKEWGDGALVRQAVPSPVPATSTGSVALDRALRVGGWPIGRICEIWGPDGVGKSTLAIHSMRQALEARPDRDVVWVDVEHRADLKYAAGHGLDLERLHIIRPQTAEDVADQVKMVTSGEGAGLFSMVVVDSVAAMLPRAEFQKAADEAVVALQAKIITRLVKSQTALASQSETTVLLINQERANLGSPHGGTQTSGGYALRHGSTIKVRLRRMANGTVTVNRVLEGKKFPQQVGHFVAAKVERNSVALAFGEATWLLLYEPTEEYGPMGIDMALDTVNVALDAGLIDVVGSWMTSKVSGVKVNGKEAMMNHLRETPSEMHDLAQRSLAILRSESKQAGAQPDDGEG